MNTNFLIKTMLFQGITEKEIESMLSCLKANALSFSKNQIIYHAGKRVDALGLILYGSVYIESHDVWGNKTLLDHVDAGQVFAETYACLETEPLMVNVVAAEESMILFLNMKQFLATCPAACPYHTRLISNLLSVMARKNLNLTHKIFHTSPKTIREKLVSYLSFQAMKQGKYEFEIPFNRQQLADYLGVDRSALSNELSKMKQDQWIDFHKNTFSLKEKCSKQDPSLEQ